MGSVASLVKIGVHSDLVKKGPARLQQRFKKEHSHCHTHEYVSRVQRVCILGCILSATSVRALEGVGMPGNVRLADVIIEPLLDNLPGDREGIRRRKVGDADGGGECRMYSVIKRTTFRVGKAVGVVPELLPGFYRWS